jgi:hypothetical protein
VPGPDNTQSVCRVGHPRHRWLALWSVDAIPFYVVPSSPEANCILTGYAGSCQNGTCQSGNILATAKVTPRFHSQEDSRPSFTNTRKFHRPGTCKTYRFPFRSQSLRPCLPSPCSGWLLVSRAQSVNVQTVVDWVSSKYRLLLSS